MRQPMSSRTVAAIQSRAFERLVEIDYLVQTEIYVYLGHSGLNLMSSG